MSSVSIVVIVVEAAAAVVVKLLVHRIKRGKYSNQANKCVSIKACL